MRRLDPATSGLLASAAAAVNVALLKIATHPVDPLDIEALARLTPEVVPWLVASLVADLAFYLLLLAVAFGLGDRVAQWAGVVYALIGATGAVILLWQWPAALYAAEVEQFERVTRVVYFGLWNGVGAVAGGVWWTVLAWRFRRRHRAFAAFTLALGVLAFIDAASFRLVSVDVAGWVLTVLLGLLMVWPAAAALGPLRRSASTRPGSAATP